MDEVQSASRVLLWAIKLGNPLKVMGDPYIKRWGESLERGKRLLYWRERVSWFKLESIADPNIFGIEAWLFFLHLLLFLFLDSFLKAIESTCTDVFYVLFSLFSQALNEQKNLMLVYFFGSQKMHLYFIFRFLKILGCTHFCNLTCSKSFSIFPSPSCFLTMKIFLLWERFKLDLSFFIHFNLARRTSYCDM